MGLWSLPPQGMLGHNRLMPREVDSTEPATATNPSTWIPQIGSRGVNQLWVHRGRYAGTVSTVAALLNQRPDP